MMNVLALDTSTDQASIALQSGDDLLFLEQPGQKTHATVLLPMIDQLMAQAGLGMNQLDAIVFGQGPGSFTGLRVACSMAKGLAHAHDIGLIPVSTLAAIAFEARGAQQHAVLAVIDARMQELYWGIYPAQSVFEPEFVSLASDIKNPQQQPLILAGVGFEVYYSDFSDTLKSQIQSQAIVYPKASAMIALANTGKIKKVSASEAEPIYIRNKVTQGVRRG